ncbi:MAG: protein phosphatase 2C domain-containing protein [Muribaculaceae bacterium]|nr:protein phosphatase 2C domain-containing protein [Muribaculaceae bacterium]
MIQPIQSKLKITGYLDSRQGGRSENQDFAGVAETPSGTLILVCDGMGGMQGGSTASKLAVTTILEYVQQADPKENPKMILVKAIQKANQTILEEGNENPDLKGMGTTVTALLINDKCATVAHVGDSRIYQLRKDKKIFRSFDHSMVFEMVKKKVITEEQARLSAQSNIILRALGIKNNIEVETHTLTYEKGDRFILCSDGFWGVMPENELIMHIASTNSIDKILDSTCNTIEAIARKKGGEYDNLTAAIIEMGQNSLMRPKMTKTAKIIIVILAVLLLISLGINIFAYQRNVPIKIPTEPILIGEVDSISVSENENTIIVKNLDTELVTKDTKLYIKPSHE